MKFHLSRDPQGPTQADLARAANCSPSWLTRVLSGDVHLTPDQAYAIGRFLQMTSDEADYFCLLVDWERAATPPLKKRLQDKLNELTEQNRGFKSSVVFDTRINDQDSMRYYSNWMYAAFHVATMISGHSDEDLADRFGISRIKAVAVLKDLHAMGLVAVRGGEWYATSKNLHLPANQMMAGIGHAIWRNKTIDHLQRGDKNGLHYSAIHCLSRSEVDVIAGILKEAVHNCRGVIDRSPPETLAVLCLDWYEYS